MSSSTTRTYVAPVLMRAKARLNADTWGQAPPGHLTVPEGKVCVMTALAPCSRLESETAKRLLYEAIFDRAPEYSPEGFGDDIAHWNDRTGRTLADVHAAYDKAIALELER